MSLRDHVSDSESSEVDLFHAPNAMTKSRERSLLRTGLSQRVPDQPEESSLPNEGGSKVVVVVPAPSKPWEYQPYRGTTTVDTVLEEVKKPGGEGWYKIEYEDGKREDVSLKSLLKLQNGQNALDFYEQIEGVEFSDTMSDQFDHSNRDPRNSSLTGKRTRTKTTNTGFVDSTTAQLDSEDDETFEDHGTVKRRRLVQGRISLLVNRTSRQDRQSSRKLSIKLPSRSLRDEDCSETDSASPKSGTQPSRGRRSKANAVEHTTRPSHARPIIKLMLKDADDEHSEADELAGEGVIESEDSSNVYVHRRERRRSRPFNIARGRSEPANNKRFPRRVMSADSSTSLERQEPSRRSGRQRTIKSMKEQDMDEDLFADEIPLESAPRAIGLREIFQPISKQSRFRSFHRKDCDVCGGTEHNSNKGTSPLIYCQGCSSSIHKVCLGYRSSREHLVTKVGHENFVMQCRRCIGVPAKKDSSAPRLDTCSGCKKLGGSCAAFSQRKTLKQEEKLREENDGEDPITAVPDELINSDANLLFRCKTCQRGWHFEHLQARSDTSESPENLDEQRYARFEEYNLAWQCKDCCEAPAKVQGLVAWRPLDRESYHAGQTADLFREDEKEYLIKWEGRSHFHCSWMPGAWVWGVTVTVMRKAFFRRSEGANLLPKWTADDAIAEEWLRVEIVFDVRYDDDYTPHSDASDRAHINNVDEIFVKFQGLGYDEAVWEKPPPPDQTERWSDFVAAYNEYLAGRYFKQQPASVMKERIHKFRSEKFEQKIELKKQPLCLTGGQIMPYQMEGLNWLLYNFYRKKNVILADEMGLGKTIQVISLLASLVKDKPKCWPFLIVTPNSTCPNWRREIKKWCPTLRVVAYYGGKHARDMAMDYELFPNHCADMRAHVVVTSYEAPVDEHSRSFFKRIKWAGMIVDEGQRLKNDENLLYAALTALRVPFQVLLTGTPLQNNKRELFNLLQFLDVSINAADLDEEYAVLTKDNLPDLHDLIRPFFLRRTKVQVLKFLPPMAQVILPVTMSVVQKKLYKSILAKDPGLIRSIFGQTKTVLRPAERGNLNNILMQLRKCLCHPFLYSSAIEERSATETALYRNLVDASAKFQLLEIMLPKLRERGHRVLLFSQFLNQLDLAEDFLSGLGLPYGRLDGSINSLEKQKRIDAFNAPNSNVFAFLLSTRSGGVGINLATADTVIIMDPDFNPHQDIQALSRAHRIGQKKKVLVFQLMTKNSAEEKIVQIGRKKMALDQALIESMGAEDDAGVDLESILKFGAEALFNDDDRDDIHYDSVSVDKLLDRTQVENTGTNEEKTAESQFSHARVWANDKGALTEDDGGADSDAMPSVPNFSVWEKILKQREADAAREAASNMQTFGRGKRARQAVDYQKQNMVLDDDVILSPPEMSGGKNRRGPRRDPGSDTDFAIAGESDEDHDSNLGEVIDLGELEPQQRRSAQGMRAKAKAKSPKSPRKSAPAPAVKQRGSASRDLIPKKNATSLVKQKFTVSKKTPQKRGNSAKEQQDTRKKPVGSVKAQATPVKSAGSSVVKMPNGSVKRPRASTKSRNASEKKVNGRSKKLVKDSSQVQMLRKKQVDSSNSQLGSRRQVVQEA